MKTNKYRVTIVLLNGAHKTKVVEAPTQTMAQSQALFETKTKEYRTCRAEKVEE